VSSLSVLPVVGLPQFDGWSQVVERKGDWGLFILSFSVQGQHAGNIGRDVVTLLEEKPATSPRVFYQRLQEVITHVQFNGAKIYLAAGLLLKDSTLLAVNSGLIFLKRGSRMGTVVESDAVLKLVEGNFQEEDIFLFLSKPAQNFLPEIKIKLEQGYDVPTIVTSIVPSVHQSDATAVSSIGAVYWEDEEKHQNIDPKRQTALKLKAESALWNPSTEKTVVGAGSLPASGATTPKIKDKFRLMSVLGKLFVILRRGVFVFFVFIWGLLHNLVRFLLRAVYEIWRLILLTFDRRHLRVESNRDRFKRLISIVILAIALVCLIWLGWSYRSRRLISANTAGLMAPITAHLESIRSVALTDPITARKQVEEVQQQLETLSSQTQSPVALNLISQTQSQADELYQEISGYEQVSALNQFYDLRLASVDFVTSRAAGNDLEAVFLDAQKQQLLVLSLSTKSIDKYDLIELDPAREVALVEKQVVLLANGVLGLTKADSSNDASWQTLVPSGDSNQAGILLGSFGPNIYIFNPEKRNIFRYIQDKDGNYSAPVGWLISPLSVGFDDVTSMAVDGDIWLTTKDGQIKRFTSGKAQEFTPTGLTQPFVGPLTIVTNQDLQALYVLEPANNRLVVLTKDGQFLKEIQSSSLGTATTIFASREIQKILAVSGSIIYEIDI